MTNAVLAAPSVSLMADPGFTCHCFRKLASVLLLVFGLRELSRAPNPIPNLFSGRVGWSIVSQVGRQSKRMAFRLLLAVGGIGFMVKAFAA